MAPRPASIKVRALQWLAQREHSHQELRDKLLRLLLGSADEAADPPGDADTAAAEVEVETLLQWLEANGYLSQARFVESRVNARQSRFGNRRIRQELQQHGVTLDAEARRALQSTEFDRACEVWRKKFGAPAEDAAARVRQMRFLAGRGFSMDVVHRVVKQGARPTDEAELGEA